MANSVNDSAESKSNLYCMESCNGPCSSSSSVNDSVESRRNLYRMESRVLSPYCSSSDEYASYSSDKKNSASLSSLNSEQHECCSAQVQEKPEKANSVEEQSVTRGMLARAFYCCIGKMMCCCCCCAIISED